MEKQKLEADRRLIKALTDCEPLDWTRRPNGDLVYLNEKGQKFILADAEIQKIRSATRERGAEMSELRRSPSAISSDSTDAALARKKTEASPTKKPGLAPEKKTDPKPSAADRSSLHEQGVETPEESQPQVDITKGDIDEVKGTD
jgi:hypothetical protein